MLRLRHFFQGYLPQPSPIPPPQTAEQSKQPPHTYPIESAKALLAPRITTIHRIEELVGVPAAHFQAFYLQALYNYAQFVQQLPNSEVPPSKNDGLLLDQTLTAITKTLALRQGYLLPPHTAIETLVHQKELWTYAVFAAALCHHLAQLAMGLTVTLYNDQGQSLGAWNPWSGNLDSDTSAFWYGVDVAPHPHQPPDRASLLLAQRILPICGLTWLASDPQVFSAWLACVSGDVSHNVLGEMISAVSDSGRDATKSGTDRVLDNFFDGTPSKDGDVDESEIADTIETDTVLLKNNNTATSSKPESRSKKTRRNTSETLKSAIQSTGASQHSGLRFLNWLVAGLQDGSLGYNTPDAHIHIVTDGVLLVTPGLFQDFIQHQNEVDAWEGVQKAFIKLGLHQRTETGLNVHQYRIVKTGSDQQIVGFLLKDVTIVFKTGTLPMPNSQVQKLK